MSKPSVVIRPLSRGTAAEAETSQLSVIQIALYLATLILGAGVFLLPLSAAGVGLLPLVVMLLCFLYPCTLLYRRVAALMVSRDRGAVGGGEALARAVVEAGAGRAGAVLALVGIAVYVVGAAIIYNRLALPSLQLLSAQLDSSTAGAATVAVLSLLGLGITRLLPARYVITRRLLTVIAVWGLTAAALVPLAGVVPAQDVLGLIGFVVGCLLTTRAPAPAEAPRRRGQLTAAHASCVAALRLQLVLMLMLAVAALIVVATSASQVIHWGIMFDGFHPGALLDAAGVILFAHVGTGVSNISDYTEVGEAGFRTSAVRLSLIVVTGVLIAWSVPTTLIFGHTGLTELSGTNSALGLVAGTAAIIGFGSGVGVGMSVLAALISLIAVTNACAGFSTSLARELIGAAAEVRPTWTLPRESVLITLVILGAAGAAGATLSLHNAMSPMLHVTGIVGGGVIVFILPLLAETGGRLRRNRFSLSACGVSLGLGVWTTMVALTEQHPGLAIQLIMITLGWSTLVPTLLAARGVMAANPAQARQAVPPVEHAGSFPDVDAAPVRTRDRVDSAA